jgi:flagellin FlaB
MYEQNIEKGGKEEMFNKFVKALNNLHKGQKGISGLETAIILIAFVTVASVLAYSVLSAGIFSAEEGQKAVYAGLEGAQSTLEVKGSVLGLSIGGSELETVQIVLGMAISGNTVDMDAVSINFWDDATSSTNVTWTYALSAQSTERGSTNLMEGDELMVVTVSIPSTGGTDVTGEAVGTGDGTTTVFTLDHAPDGGPMTVTVGGTATTEYTVSGTTITFGTAPANSAAIVASYSYGATTGVGIYDTFTLQVLPPNGSALTIQRTLPGAIYSVMTLN